MLAVLVTVPTVTQNSLRPLSPSSCIACHLLDFMVQGKITEADTSTNNLPGCHPIRTIGAPTSIIPPFLRWISAATLPIYPGLGQAPNNTIDLLVTL